MDRANNPLLAAAQEQFLYGLKKKKTRWSDPDPDDMPVATMVQDASKGDGEKAVAKDPSKILMSADPPPITLICGQYGMGKTSLVRRIAARPGAGRVVFPVTLGRLKKQFGVAMKSDPDAKTAFTGLLDSYFGGKVIDDRAARLNELLREVQQGSVALALDGLDELIDAHRNDFDYFFTALAAYLGDWGPARRFAVVVTIRSELLTSLGLNPVEKLRDAVLRPWAPGGRPSPLYLITLEEFGDTHIRRYLGSRGFSDWAPVLRNYRVRSFLSRPLHLALFREMLDKAPSEFRARIDGGKIDTVELFDQFFESVEEVELPPDDSLAGRSPQGAYVWDYKKLARLAVTLYQKGDQEGLTADEVKDCIHPAKGGGVADAGAEDAVVGLGGDIRLQIVHKCPFLFLTVADKSGEPGCEPYVFSHQIFFEYFVARGIMDQVKECSPGTPQDNLAFDYLVLTVDTRRFLRDMFDRAATSKQINENWQARTKRSYKLGDEALKEWPAGSDVDHLATRDRLEKVRWNLLKLMTDPEQEMKDPGACDRAVDEFLALARKPGRLHPRYAMYCLEGCAVYATHRKLELGDHEFRRRKKEIEAIVVQHLKFAHDKFRPVSSGHQPLSDLRLDYLLLLERALQISLRLNIGASRDVSLHDTRDLLAFATGEDLQDVVRRIGGLLKAVNRAAA